MTVTEIDQCEENFWTRASFTITGLESTESQEN